MAAAANHHPVLGELLDSRQKFVILLSLMLTMFVSALDQTIVSTATPRILADLGGFPLISWVFTIYLLASTVVVPLVGKLSDMFGRKPFIVAGIAVFVAASAACGAAQSMPMLIVARGVQGIGGGLLFGSVFATMGDLYTPIERAKYMGFMISVFTIASLTGPTIGGFLTDGPGWRWCFYINLPVGALATYFIMRNLPQHARGGSLSSIDFLGAGLLSAGTIAVLLGLVWADEKFGWTAPETLGLFAAGTVLLVAFFFQERRHPEAILPLHLFRNRVFMQGNLLQVFQGTAQMGPIAYLPTFIQTALGASATASGLVSTPQSLAMLVSTIFGGQLVSRTGRYKVMIIVGGVFSLVGVVLLHTLDAGSPEWHISVFMIVTGVGGGLIGPTIGVVTQSAVSVDAVGVATAGRQFSMQIGQVIAVAVFGLVFTTTYVSGFETDVPPAVREQIPAAVYEDFKDPTLQLDTDRYTAASEAIRAVPGGEATLATATLAQREGVATAMQRLFLISIVLAVLALTMALTIPEIMLRRTFGSSDEETEGGEAIRATPLFDAH